MPARLSTSSLGKAIFVLRRCPQKHGVRKIPVQMLVSPQRYRKRAGTFLATSSPLLIMHWVNQINGNSPRDQALPDRTLSIVATLYLCLLKTPKDREGLAIFAPPPYRRGHDHDPFHRRFHTRLPASSPRLPGTRARRAANQVSVAVIGDGGDHGQRITKSKLFQID
jgi:hypothetical protein